MSIEQGAGPGCRASSAGGLKQGELVWGCRKGTHRMDMGSDLFSRWVGCHALHW